MGDHFFIFLDSQSLFCICDLWPYRYTISKAKAPCSRETILVRTPSQSLSSCILYAYGKRWAPNTTYRGPLGDTFWWSSEYGWGGWGRGRLDYAPPPALVFDRAGLRGSLIVRRVPRTVTFQKIIRNQSFMSKRDLEFLEIHCFCLHKALLLNMVK